MIILKEHTERYIKFLQEAAKPNGKPYSEVYINNIRYYTDKFDEPITIEKINDLIKSHQYHPPLARALGTFFTWYKYGKLDKKSRKKATEKLYVPPSQTQKKTLKERILSFEDIDKLFKGVPTLEDRLLLEVFYFTSARKGAILKMSMENTDFNKKQCVISEGKGGKVNDLYWEDEQTNQDLMEYIKEKKITKGLIFNKFSASSMWYRIKKLCKDILGKDVTPHDFRRTSLTHIAAKGGDILDVKAKAHHADIQTAMKYVELGKERARDVTKKFLSRHP